MYLFTPANFRLCGFFLLLVATACLPVWSVEFFLNQDGSGHLYSSYLMLELFRGNPPVGDLFAFNSLSVPNSSGHWLLALLLNFFSPFTATKIIVTLTFAGFVASVGWLRWKTNGPEGLKTSLLIGTAIGFNLLWLLGFYNFIIGVICFALTTGLFFAWREKMNFWRAAIISFLLLLTYFSHLVSFAVLAGSLFLLAFSASKEIRNKNIFWLSAAILPVLPLAVLYKSLSAGGGGFFPVWRNLGNPFSPLSWLSQIRTADLFILISRKAFPFVRQNSIAFAVFTPLLWICAALAALFFATFFQKDRPAFPKTLYIFVFLFFSTVGAALISPDDFGLTNGSILRERLLLCGIIFFIPFFQAEHAPKLKKFAQGCLLLVIVFQTAAVWDYSLQTDRVAREFLSTGSALAGSDSAASVVLLEEAPRFSSFPLTGMSNYLGINSKTILWDNYELGHYLFPIVAKNPSDKEFVYNLTTAHVFSLHNPSEIFERDLSKLDSTLQASNGKIKTIVLWGRDSRIESVLNKWFEAEPFYEQGRVRLFRLKKIQTPAN